MSSLSPVHTIGSQIVEALRLHRKLGARPSARARNDRSVAAGRNPATRDKMIDRYTFEFSGGMRQRGDDRHGAGLQPRKS
jgi:peptide/nickel transport system ATP-binding protein